MNQTRDIEQEAADAQLVKRALQGDDAAFEALVLRYKALMLLVAYRQCRNEVDAEDVAQEALYRAYRQLGHLDNPARFKSWAMRITANAAVDLLRRRRPSVSLDQQEVSSAELAVSENPGASYADVVQQVKNTAEGRTQDAVQALLGEELVEGEDGYYLAGEQP